jgi:hypothetical protein
LPAVSRFDIREGRGDTAFGHYRVSFAEERLANEARLGPTGTRFNSRPQTRAASADDDDVVFEGLVLIHDL